MENKTTVNEQVAVAKTRYVVNRDGVRMSYEEWLDMVRSERD